MTKQRKSRRKDPADLKVRPWAQEEDAFLLQHYPARGPQWCSEAMQALGYQRTRSSVDNRGFKLGLRYTGAPLGRFKKGHETFNKGKKMPAEIYAKAAPTMFKKGNRTGAANINYKPVGHETYRTTDGYWWVKVAEGKWKEKHRLVWEKHYGPIPRGHVVRFRDGNPHNFNLSNLELVTRAQHAVRNRWSQPSEYALLQNRPACAALKKQGFRAKDIRQNPELLQLARAQTFINIQKRKRHAQSQK